MQKKIVAGICAAALALAMPVAAFAANTHDFTGESSDVTASIAKVENGNVTLSDITIHGVKDYVTSVVVDKAGTGAAPSNAVAGSSAAFKIQAYGINNDGNALNELSSFGTKYNSFKATVTFAEAVTANLPINAALDNLYVGAKFVPTKGGVVVDMPAQELTVAGQAGAPDGVLTASTAAGSVDMKGLGTGVLTVWMQNGKYAASDANPADVAKEAQDGSKSPKTGELL